VYDDLKLNDRIAAETTQEAKDQVYNKRKITPKEQVLTSLGFEKNRGEEAEENFYDIENFTFNYSYNETNHRDFEIANLQEQNVTTGFVYNHSFKPLTIAPFVKKRFTVYGAYWKWLKELNLSLLPSTVTVNSNINRNFNQQQFRDVLEPGVDALDLPLLQQRNYLFNWQYALNYTLTKSLRLNIQASNSNIVRNYFNQDNNSASLINQELDIWDGFWDIGEPNRHAQQLQLNYDLPFKLVPVLDFITGQYSYTSNFDWQRGWRCIN